QFGIQRALAEVADFAVVLVKSKRGAELWAECQIALDVIFGDLCKSRILALSLARKRCQTKCCQARDQPPKNRMLVHAAYLAPFRRSEKQEDRPRPCLFLS